MYPSIWPFVLIGVIIVSGRIGCAWLSDLHLCKRKHFYMAGMFLSGLVAYFMPLAKTYLQLLLCTSGFGLASGAYIGLTVALFADAFGNEKVCLVPSRLEPHDIPYY